MQENEGVILKAEQMRQQVSNINLSKHEEL